MVAARGYALAIKAVEHRALNCHGTPYGTLMGTTNGTPTGTANGIPVGTANGTPRDLSGAVPGALPEAATTLTQGDGVRASGTVEGSDSDKRHDRTVAAGGYFDGRLRNAARAKSSGTSPERQSALSDHLAKARRRDTSLAEV